VRAPTLSCRNSVYSFAANRFIANRAVLERIRIPALSNWSGGCPVLASQRLGMAPGSRLNGRCRKFVCPSFWYVQAVARVIAVCLEKGQNQNERSKIHAAVSSRCSFHANTTPGIGERRERPVPNGSSATRRKSGFQLAEIGAIEEWRVTRPKSNFAELDAESEPRRCAISDANDNVKDSGTGRRTGTRHIQVAIHPNESFSSGYFLWQRILTLRKAAAQVPALRGVEKRPYKRERTFRRRIAQTMWASYCWQSAALASGYGRHFERLPFRTLRRRHS
jgi:hypothetical protein